MSTVAQSLCVATLPVRKANLQVFICLPASKVLLVDPNYNLFHRIFCTSFAVRGNGSNLGRIFVRILSVHRSKTEESFMSSSKIQTSGRIIIYFEVAVNSPLTSKMKQKVVHISILQRKIMYTHH